MNSMKMQKDMTLKDELPRPVDAQYAAREEQTNNSRKNQKTGLKLKKKKCPVVNVVVMQINSDAIKNNIAKETGMLSP